MKKYNCHFNLVRLVLLGSVLTFVMQSCMQGRFENFERRKYLDLKNDKEPVYSGLASGNYLQREEAALTVLPEHLQQETKSGNKIIPDPAIETMSIPTDSTIVCDTLHLRNGEVKVVEIQEQGYNKVYYTEPGRSLEAWSSIPKWKIKKVSMYDENGVYSDQYRTDKNNFLVRKIALVLLLTSIASIILLAILFSSYFWIQVLVATTLMCLIGFIVSTFALKLSPEKTKRLQTLAVIAMISLAATAFSGYIIAAGLFLGIFLIVPAAIVFVVSFLLMAGMVFSK